MAQAGAAVCIWGTNEEKNRPQLTKLQGPWRQSEGASLRCPRRGGGGGQLFAETVKTMGRVDAFFATRA